MLTDFKNRLIYLNDIIYFDANQFLREKTSDAVKLQEYIEEAINLLNRPLNMEDEYFLRGTLGNLYRIYGEPKKAIIHLQFCLHYAKKRQEISKEVVSLIRLGEALKYDNKHDEALNMFKLVLEKCKSNNIVTYLDFVLQHKGKCLMELSRLDEAEECFLEALKLRQEKGNLELIESTQKAINLIKEVK